MCKLLMIVCGPAFDFGNRLPSTGKWAHVVRVSCPDARQLGSYDPDPAKRSADLLSEQMRTDAKTARGAAHGGVSQFPTDWMVALFGCSVAVSADAGATSGAGGVGGHSPEQTGAAAGCATGRVSERVFFMRLWGLGCPYASVERY